MTTLRPALQGIFKSKTEQAFHHLGGKDPQIHVVVPVDPTVPGIQTFRIFPDDNQVGILVKRICARQGLNGTDGGIQIITCPELSKDTRYPRGAMGNSIRPFDAVTGFLGERLSLFVNSRLTNIQVQKVHRETRAGLIHSIYNYPG